METNQLIGEDLVVTDPTWGRIHVRNKRPTTETHFDPERIVIMQHGATYGSVAFDQRFNGVSWMDYLAMRGFDAYCLDLPGYGNSERPTIMDEPAGDNAPFMRTPDAASCLARVVDFVCERRGVPKVSLIGWSWGTAIASYFSAGAIDRVTRLVLYAPVWDRRESGPSPIQPDGPLGAYRTVSREATLARRQRGLSDADKSVMPSAWFDEWWAATAASDPLGAGETIRAPNGVVLDGIEYWEVGRPLYDPAKLSIPVLVVVGEWDQDTPVSMAQTLFPKLTSAPWRRLSVLSGGTHTMLMERNRMLLFRSVSQFLEEPPPGAEAVT